MNNYNHKKIEAKWQNFWAIKKTFASKDFCKKPKKFILVEFPYPSGADDRPDRYFRVDAYPYQPKSDRRDGEP